jgi:hypothetical protein
MLCYGVGVLPGGVAELRVTAPAPGAAEGHRAGSGGAVEGI